MEVDEIPRTVFVMKVFVFVVKKKKKKDRNKEFQNIRNKGGGKQFATLKIK